MTTFVDTSALYAFLDRDDAFNTAAVEAIGRLLEEQEPLITHNYVIVETAALVQTRLGLGALRDLQQGPLDAVRVVWVDAEIHAFAWTALLASGKRTVSLVDRVSFEVMRRRSIRRALAFDDDFAEEGFDLLGPQH